MAGTNKRSKVMCGTLTSSQSQPIQWRMQDFLKGGSVTVSRKFLKPHPLLIKNTPIFDRFRERILALPVNQSVFDRNFC